MKKIVINSCHGGFGISEEATKRLRELGMSEAGVNWYWNILRDDSRLVQVVEELGEKANGKFAALKVVEIPDDVAWEINEIGGKEWIAEKHRTWE